MPGRFDLTELVKKKNMEVSRLASDLKYVEINGVTINLEERSRIDLACMQLASDLNQGVIYFWGKIRGKFASPRPFWATSLSVMK